MYCLSISKKSSKYFLRNPNIFLNFKKISKKLSQTLLEIPLTTFQNIFKIFLNCFLQISVLELLGLFYLKIS